MKKRDYNQIDLPLGVPFDNRGLFADHFLNDPQQHLLKTLSEWQQADGLDEDYRAIQKLFEDKAARFHKNTKEAQTERDFIRPVLNVLWGDDYYQVQEDIPTQRRPDYAFFREAKDRVAADRVASDDNKKHTIEYWRDVPVLGDAKKWSDSLDKQRGADENPSSQIANYLYRSRVRWGILTNGRQWRLYEREKSSAGGVFYEVNLENLLNRNDREAFKYFYLFFRRQAFLPDPTGRSFIDKVFQGSVDYATDVGDSLKESVYDALRLLMNGFFEFENPSNELNRKDPGTVKLVHENCLIVLYRLLFLLFAEDKKLLPVDNPVYKDHSLKKRHQEINDSLRKEHRTYLREEHYFWGELTALFELIDNGLTHNGKIIIPAYNGGLFNPQRHPHIAHTAQPGVRRWQIGDDRLTEVIDMLAYQREVWNKPGVADIDYNSLDVRHLGSIYEGLLELQPHIAPEALIEAIDKEKTVFKPAHEVPTPRPIHGQPPHEIQAEEVYLVTNRGERKATGSYYTPQYIVSYIVEHTVGPLTEEAARKTAKLAPEVRKEIKKFEKTWREWKQTDDEAQAEKFTRQITITKRQLLDPYLSLKILDPAMGSGHFLVGAADFLSMAMATDPHLGVPEDLGDEELQAYYKRLVVEHCLYGVDLNPLAVELAKLSLWLHTASRNKALSFLDHHLRCGNSLIGARVEDDLMKEPPRLNASGRRVNTDSRQVVLGFTEVLTANHLSYLLDTFRMIVETPTGDAETERIKDKLYLDMDAERDRYRAVANCWLAPYFGTPVTPEQYQQAVNALRDSAAFAKIHDEPWFTAAQSVAQVKRFFHWELEFPEVFFDASGIKAKEERGVDAIVGNPPYGLITDLATKALVQQTFVTTQYQPDYYVAFMERAYRLTRPAGYQSEIVPTTFLAMHYFSTIRRFMLDHSRLISLVHFKFPVFNDPTVESAIYINKSDSDAQRRRENLVVCIVTRNLDEFITKCSDIQIIPQVRFEEIHENDFNFALASEGAQIVRKMQQGPVDPLSHLCDMTVGIKPYQTGKGKPKQTKEVVENRIFDADHRKDMTYHQYLMGRDIDRFVIDPREERWISYGDWLAERRPEAPFFEPKRLLVRQTGDSIIATIEDKQRLTLNNIHNLKAKRALPIYEYLLAVLNSRLITHFHQTVVPEEDRPFAEVKIVDLEQLPIRRIEFKTPTKERTQLLKEGTQRCERCLTTNDNQSVLEFVEQQLAAKPEQADVVHDLLAYLAEQMIETNKQKQAEVKSFLTWLERQIGAKTDDLKNKTKLKDYHEYDLDALLAVLQSNRHKLGEGVNPTARNFQEAIEQEFTKSLAKLTPLKAKLTATDTLIDEIVYRLYGLTADEIKLVEKSAERASR